MIPRPLSPSPSSSFSAISDDFLSPVLDLFSSTPPSTLFLTFDPFFLQSIISDLDLDPKQSLSILLGYQDYLAPVPPDCPLPITLRFIIGLSHFAFSLLERNSEAFINLFITTLAHLRSQLSQDSADVASPILSLCFSELSRVIPILSSEYDREFRVLESTLQLCLAFDFLTANDSAQGFEVFFLSAFVAFPLDHSASRVCFTDLVALITGLLARGAPFDERIDLPALVQQLTASLRASSVPLETRGKLFNIVSTLAGMPEGGGLLARRESLSAFSQYILNYLEWLPFEFELPPAPEPAFMAATVCQVAGFIQPAFEREFEIGEEEVEFGTNDIQGIVPLCTAIFRLCQNASGQSPAAAHLRLIQLLIGTGLNVRIVPFFAVSWISTLLSKYADLTLDQLWGIGLLQAVLEQAFLIYRHNGLMESSARLIMRICEMYELVELPLIGLFDVFLQAMQCCCVSRILVKCLLSCASKNLTSFQAAANRTEFVTKFSNHMLVLQTLPQTASSRRPLLQMLWEITNDKNVLPFSMENARYLQVLLFLFYDSSTARFGSLNIQQILREFDVNSESVQFVLRFFNQKLLFANDIPLGTLNLLIQTLANGLSGDEESGSVLAQSHFLDRLVSFAVQKEASESIELLILLVNRSLAIARSDSDLFAAMSPLINGSLVHHLFKIAFNDELEMAHPRAIRKAAPLSSLFRKFQNDELSLQEFVIFLENCFRTDTRSRYSRGMKAFTAQLVQYLSTFRDKHSVSKSFHHVLNLLVELSQFAFTSQTLSTDIRLFTTLPGRCRPAFTEQLLDGLTTMLTCSPSGPIPFFMSRKLLLRCSCRQFPQRSFAMDLCLKSDLSISLCQ
jgi:hypothetical protein